LTDDLVAPASKFFIYFEIHRFLCQEANYKRPRFNLGRHGGTNLIPCLLKNQQAHTLKYQIGTSGQASEMTIINE